MSDATGAPPRFSILVPTRHRLPLLRRFLDGLLMNTAEPERVEVVLAVDEDDHASRDFVDARFRMRRVVLPPGSTMGRINQTAFEASSGRYVLGMNDDIHVHTRGWDARAAAVFARHDDDIALVFGNDLLFGERLCTFPIVSRRAALAIGFSPEIYRRYRIDDHIFEVYQLLAHVGHPRIYYLPEMVFEHDHYEAPRGRGKARRVYVAEESVLAKDAGTFDAHLEDRKAAALRLRNLIEESARERGEANARERLTRVADSSSYRHPEAVAVVRHARRRPASSRPTVVVVSADIQSPHARKCLSAVKACTPACDLMVLDNGRADGFNHAREMNRALSSARSDLVVFLDDDVFVRPRWLEHLVAALDARTAVVTPLHKDARGRLSYSGAYLNGDGRGTHEHARDLPRRTRATLLACSAAMLVDRRKLPDLRVRGGVRRSTSSTGTSPCRRGRRVFASCARRARR